MTWQRFGVLLPAAVVLMLLNTASAQYTYKQIYNFEYLDGNGMTPNGGLIFDGAGNVYGTTSWGGDVGSGGCYNTREPSCGTVFEFTPDSNGGWTESILYTFAGFDDGSDPTAGLIFGPNGNLYGTTTRGGGSNGDCVYRCGTVFQLAPSSTGWNESLLHTFTGSPDGYDPAASLVLGRDGNLYGTTRLGGVYGGGTVFELINSSGVWTEKILHSFTGRDGGDPEAGLIFDQSGNLYGTTLVGGTYNYGTVFELVHDGGGWTERSLYDFTGGSDGGWSFSSLMFDADGNLYGTAYLGGDTSDCISQYTSWKGCGVVFELTPTESGSWNETVLYSFLGGNDAAYPVGDVIFDSEGNLYGITVGGGGSVDAGTIYELSPGASGWSESIIQNFSAEDNGQSPGVNLLVDSSGDLYESTHLSGTGYCCGTLFELIKGSK